MIPVEIKSGETISSDFFAGLIKWNALAENETKNSYIIYGGEENQMRSQGTALSWKQMDSLPLLLLK